MLHFSIRIGSSKILGWWNTTNNDNCCEEKYSLVEGGKDHDDKIPDQQDQAVSVIRIK